MINILTSKLDLKTLPYPVLLEMLNTDKRCCFGFHDHYLTRDKTLHIDWVKVLHPSQHKNKSFQRCASQPIT